MVTVLMATYQGKQYLEQQLDTILAQTVPVKILISDDGSDDGTREMLESYAGWYPEQVFLHHRTQHTGGAAGNFFWLMQEALKDEKNEYIFFSDQDDVWENNKVSVMLHRMKVLEIDHDPDYLGEHIVNRSTVIRCHRGSAVDAYCREYGYQTEYL